MANFMYLFRGGFDSDANVAAAQMQAQMQKWVAWMQQLGKTGNFKSGEPLEKTGKVLHAKKKNIHDGPYAEAKDVIGGYLIVSAENLEHATELAKGCPILENEGGTVEVRPVREMKP
ncbi:MAG TPA: YciI family protein [Polyangia bacterium]|nr:YciI family protein [Polyangia bacterium]